MGLARLPAWPGGTATAETFAWLRAEIVEALRAQMPVDAVLLALHGALVAEGTPDVEGAVLQAVREVIGPRVPLPWTMTEDPDCGEMMGSGRRKARGPAAGSHPEAHGLTRPGERRSGCCSLCCCCDRVPV